MAEIYLIRTKYLFGLKIFCLNQTNFVSFEQNISLHQRKCFKQIIFSIQSNIFSECISYFKFTAKNIFPNVQ